MYNRFGHRLIGMLTPEEIGSILDAFFRMIKPQNRRIFLSHLEPELAEKIRGLMDAEAVIQDREAGRKRMEKKWHSLWKRWNQMVDSLGNENGLYVVVEHQWDVPHFDVGRFIDDLDGLSAKLNPLLEAANEYRIAPDTLFETALSTIEEQIRENPQWAGDSPVICTLGVITTQCILKWLSLTSPSAKDVIERVLAISRSRIVELNLQAFQAFFPQLTEARRREVYDFLRRHSDEPFWEQQLNHSESPWHSIFHSLSQEFDVDSYLGYCRKMIPDNWQYGIPVINDLLEKNLPADAGIIYEQTLASYARQAGFTDWRPETGLLIQSQKYSRKPSDMEIVDLLEGWANVAQSLGLPILAHTLRFQEVTFRDPHDWDAVVQVVGTQAHENMHPLIQQWQDYLISTTLGYNPDSPFRTKSCWIRWLLEAGLETEKGSVWFLEQLEGWMDQLMQHPKMFLERQQEFLLLAVDLFSLSGFQRRVPNLMRAMQASLVGDWSHVEARRQWLSRMGAEKFRDRALENLKTQITKLIPHPEYVQISNYDHHARWLLATRDLSPETYRSVRETWEGKYQRRKSLWRTIAKYEKLPVE